MGILFDSKYGRCGADESSLQEVFIMNEPIKTELGNYLHSGGC